MDLIKAQFLFILGLHFKNQKVLVGEGTVLAVAQSAALGFSLGRQRKCRAAWKSKVPGAVLLFRAALRLCA